MLRESFMQGATGIISFEIILIVKTIDELKLADEIFPT